MKNLIQPTLMQHMQQNHVVLARMYANGSWHQFSGKDVCSHIYLATQYWHEIFHEKPKQSLENINLIFIVQNSYHTFVASFGAILKQMNIIWAPIHTSKDIIKNITRIVPCTAIVTDMEDAHFDWSQFDIPVIGIQKISWITQEFFGTHQRKKFQQMLKSQIGEFRFVSHESNFKITSFSLDSFIKTAKNFIEQSNIPEHILWQSAELMPLEHPFAHLSKFCALLKSGIIGFPSANDIETSLSILKPTYLFAGRYDLEQVAAIANLYHEQSSNILQIKIKKTLSKFQRFLGTSKAMKIPENLFAMLKRGMRTTSRLLASNAFMPNGFDNLRFIVHGLSPASKQYVQLFESYGIPVIETYGSPLAAGMLASNTFNLPHLNIIGSPLAHVYFRLGAQSQLEYRFSNEFTDTAQAQIWHKTNDTVQMTPFGFMLANSKTHGIEYS